MLQLNNKLKYLKKLLKRQQQNNLDSKNINIIEQEGYTLIGKISKTHGYDGAVLITLDVDNPEDFETLESVFVAFNGKLVPFFVENIAYSGKTNLRLTFFDYQSNKKINEFVGCSLFLPNDCFPDGKDDEDDEGLIEFVGFNAINIATGKTIGSIIGIIENPAHPLFEIDSKGKTILVPAVDDFISSIDQEKKIIVFSLPEGLLEL
jgi:16S rRNA processing protein RimM